MSVHRQMLPGLGCPGPVLPAFHQGASWVTREMRESTWDTLCLLPFKQLYLLENQCSQSASTSDTCKCRISEYPALVGVTFTSLFLISNTQGTQQDQPSTSRYQTEDANYNRFQRVTILIKADEGMGWYAIFTARPDRSHLNVSLVHKFPFQVLSQESWVDTAHSPRHSLPPFEMQNLSGIWVHIPPLIIFSLHSFWPPLQKSNTFLC